MITGPTPTNTAARSAAVPFPFTCPSCRHTSQVFDHLAGTQAKCPSCAAVVNIPPLAIRTTPPAPSDPPLVRAADGPAPPPPKSAGRAVLPVALAVAGLLAVFCCGGGGIAAFLFSRHHDEPTDPGVARATSPSTRQTPTTSLAVDEDKQPPAY